MYRSVGIGIVLFLLQPAILLAEGTVIAPVNTEAVLSSLKVRCVRCHGPALAEGGLDLSLPRGLRTGGDSGALLEPGNLSDSLIWQRVSEDEMPPDHPLSDQEKSLLKDWILTGADEFFRKLDEGQADENHWAFQELQQRPLPTVADASRIRNPIDLWIQSRLEQEGLTIGPEASRETLIRRVSFDLTGLPPTIEEIDRFLADTSSDAYERMVDRYLQSEHYGERWGKYWLDTAGYADSNGYFGADTVRPYAYRYRDYVIRSLNADKPWDQFLREQLAGDEIAGYVPGADVEPCMVELLEAVHFLQNSPDGTDSSDGNPEEVRADKYAVLDGTVQIIGTALMGMTVQCARCHDHKFEPFTQKDYFQLQAVIFPAFDVEQWVTPGKRLISTASPAERADWERQNQEVDEQIAAARKAYLEWERENREPSAVVFQESRESPSQNVADQWTNRVPGDAKPAGNPPVQLDETGTPAARIVDGTLQILAGKESGDRVLSTRQVFDWTPENPQDWIQVTFDLVAEGPPAPYVGYYIALRDFNNRKDRLNGNVLIDGSSKGKAEIHLNYPGSSSTLQGRIGTSRYKPGQNFGIRVTNVGKGTYELAHVVDGVLEDGTLRLSAGDLPDGAFGFEYCCGRSYHVANVQIETSISQDALRPQSEEVQKTLRERRAELKEQIRQIEKSRPQPIELLPVLTDRSGPPTEVHLLLRGSPQEPGDVVQPAAPALFGPEGISELLEAPDRVKGPTTGRRLALAEWLTKPESQQASLLARVTVNRWWNQHFGRGIVSTVDNLGYSGAAPTHRELLDDLAGHLIEHGWSAKELHRLIVQSATYRQSSQPSPLAGERDPENRWYSRYPMHRLDAEAIRDGLLAVSGNLDRTRFGPPVQVAQAENGDVIPSGDAAQQRRSLYLQQRRTQVVGLLETFDAPSLVFNCTNRNRTTVPLQSLTLLNSHFVREQAKTIAARIRDDLPADADAGIFRAFRTILGRSPTEEEFAVSQEFLSRQPSHNSARTDADHLAWVDLCQMLLASNGFLYLE